MDEYLPLSFLNQLEYCERRFWLMYVLGEMDVNAPVLEGSIQHERAHSGEGEREGETVIHRRLHVWSDRLRLIGFADVVEEAAGELLPVEHKHGKMGRWLNDHVQLCAQAMCLEERTGRDIGGGEIFYWGSRRRERVEFTPALRARTETAVARVAELVAAGVMPAPLDNAAKCRDCSLEGICLPREVEALNRKQAQEAS